MKQSTEDRHKYVRGMLVEKAEQLKKEWVKDYVSEACRVMSEDRIVGLMYTERTLRDIFYGQ